MPVARKTDPWTSWAAAKSVTDLRSKQAAVLYVLACHGPLSLRELVDRYARPDGAPYPPQSESGIRTRCAELMKLGWVKVSHHQFNENHRSERVLRAELPKTRGQLF